MANFQITVPHDKADPQRKWSEVADHIEAAFRACEGAEVTLHQMPDDGSINIDVRLADDCDPVLMKLTLRAPPWRTDL